LVLCVCQLDREETRAERGSEETAGEVNGGGEGRGGTKERQMAGEEGTMACWFALYFF
jgi:hypothetical protein